MRRKRQLIAFHIYIIQFNDVVWQKKNDFLVVHAAFPFASSDRKYEKVFRRYIDTAVTQSIMIAAAKEND